MRRTHLSITALIAATLVCPAFAMAQEQKHNEAAPHGGGQPMGHAAEPHAAQPPAHAAQPPAHMPQQHTAPAPRTGQNEPKQPNKAMPHAAQGQPKQAEHNKTAQPNGAKAPEKFGDKGQQEHNKAAGTNDRNTPKANNTAQDHQKGAPKAAENRGEHERVQLSSQQQNDVRRVFTSERNINRVNVRTEVRVGSRVPRSVRLAVLPAALISIVPAYRTYRYFVEDDQVCIVEPTTYEIVEVIPLRNNGQPTLARLQLSDQERQIVLSDIDMGSGDRGTLGLGALEAGAPVPRNVDLRVMPSRVVDDVPKLRDYKYFVAEDRLAIVDPSGQRIELVLEGRR